MANQTHHKVNFRTDKSGDISSIRGHFDLGLQPLAGIALRAATFNGVAYSIDHPGEHQVELTYPAVHIGRATLRLLLGAKEFKSNSERSITSRHEIFVRWLRGNQAQVCSEALGLPEPPESVRLAMRHGRPELPGTGSTGVSSLELSATLGNPETNFYHNFATTVLANDDEMPTVFSGTNSLSIISGEIGKFGFLEPPARWASPVDCLEVWERVMRL